MIHTAKVYIETANNYTARTERKGFSVRAVHFHTFNTRNTLKMYVEKSTVVFVVNMTNLNYFFTVLIIADSLIIF